MATTGEYADLFSSELAIARGTVQARAQELREAKLIPIGGRGGAAVHLGVGPVSLWCLSLLLDASPGGVAHAVRAARGLPRAASENEALQPFADLTVASASTLGEAFESLILDAAAGRLQRWKAFGGMLSVDIVDGAVAQIQAHQNVISHRRDVGEINFARPRTIQRAPSLYRVMRLDSRIFESLAAVLTRTEARDPITGERILVKS